MSIACRTALTVSLLLLLIATAAHAHPEDEFCVPGETSLDPALCEQLAALDAANSAAAVADPAVAVDLARSPWATAALYVTIGVRHILPGGVDHILFVLALFLAVTRWQSLAWQVSAFTLAHTLTLALAATGVLRPDPALVEPLIAFTIAMVAAENLVFRESTRWRPFVVFGFGLIHGLGFAGFFAELGLPPGQFWSSLIGFNVGVELGQLAVIAAAAAIVVAARRGLRLGARDYRRWIVLPASLAIGLVGAWWTLERLAG